VPHTKVVHQQRRGAVPEGSTLAATRSRSPQAKRPSLGLTAMATREPASRHEQGDTFMETDQKGCTARPGLLSRSGLSSPIHAQYY
jgi:hypothetical protein